MSTILIAILVAVLSLSYLWVKRRFRFWKDRGFVQAEASFPFGSIGGIGFSISTAEGLDKFYKQFKGKAPAVGFYNFLAPQILPIDPELVKNILVREFQSFHDRGFYYNREDDPMSAK
jgi:cytochrome P450 family 6